VRITSSRSFHLLANPLSSVFAESLARLRLDARTECRARRGYRYGSVYGYRRESDRGEGAHRVEGGQATVEFALVLLALVSVVWALLSLCLVVRDQVLVTHASREAARTYAVSRSVHAATIAARDRSGLGTELTVTVEPQADSLARISVSLGIASRIPILGRIRPDIRLQSSLITYVEPG
jgi:hypothetical protein